jgi:hypothetical protein
MDTPRSKTVPTRSPRHAARPARRALALAVVAVLSLSACASGLARKDEVGLKYADYAGEPVDTVRTLGAVNGWTPVSRTQLVIWTGVNEAWLLTVWDSCRDLTFANGISVTRSGRQITKFDNVLVGEERCAITEIRPVDVKQMKADRKAVKAEP